VQRVLLPRTHAKEPQSIGSLRIHAESVTHWGGGLSPLHHWRFGLLSRHTLRHSGRAAFFPHSCYSPAVKGSPVQLLTMRCSQRTFTKSAREPPRAPAQRFIPDGLRATTRLPNASRRHGTARSECERAARSATLRAPPTAAPPKPAERTSGFSSNRKTIDIPTVRRYTSG